MGVSHSHSYNFVGSNNTIGDTKSIFEISYDEEAYNTKFVSDLLSTKPEKMKRENNLPDQASILNIITDPLIFTTCSSPEEAWRDVLSPLINGSENSRPYIHQLLSSLFRFFKERPIPFIEQETRHKIEIEEKIKQDRINIGSIHTSFAEPIVYINDELLSKFLDGKENVFNFIESFFKLPKTPHPTYNLLSNYLLRTYEESNDPGKIYFLLKWGILSSDLSSVINAFVGITKLMIKQDKTPIKYNFHEYSKILTGIPLLNCIYLPPSNPNLPSTKIPQISILNSSSFTCDGKKLFILAKNLVITSYSLDNSTINFEDRQFRQILPDHQNYNGLAYSNGYLVLSSRSSKVPVVLSADTLEFYPLTIKYATTEILKSSPIVKLKPPFCSDGYLIYSLRFKKRRIAVFYANPPIIHFTKYINLQGEIPPKKPNSIVFTNGIVFSIFVHYSNENSKHIFNVFIYSLIDGKHIKTIKIAVPYRIDSIISDPWNNCVWNLGRHNNNNLILTRMPMSGINAPFITGVITDSVSPLPPSQFSQVNTNDSAFSMIYNFLNYYSSHFSGCSFKLSLLDQNLMKNQTPLFYDHESAQLFGPCTIEIVDSIINAIDYFYSQFLNFFDPRRTQIVICSLLHLLDYNLSNFESYISYQDFPKTLIASRTNKIVNIIFSILNEENLSIVHQSAAFLAVNSFSFLFLNNKNLCTKMFNLLYDRMSPIFNLYMIKKLYKSPLFLYCFSNCRQIFASIFKKMSSQNQKLTCVQEELVHYFLSRLMYDMKSNYAEIQFDIKESQTLLQNIFFNFSIIMTEEMIRHLKTVDNKYDDEAFRKNSFIKLFGRWLMLLEPYSKFARVSTLMVSFLQPLFSEFREKLQQMQIENPVKPNRKSFYYIYELYFEISSLYLDFVTALLNGGDEMKDAAKYKWLISTTKASEITLKTVKDLTNSMYSSASINGTNFLRRGLSFNYTGDSISSNEILDFITHMISPNESSSIQSLFDFLYSKLNNPLNKRLTTEQRHLERILMAAFMKQLGFSSELMEISIKLLTNETPVLTHIIRQSMESIYRIRRILRESQQATAQLAQKNKENAIQIPPSNITEDYFLYTRQITEKCIFLLHIQPCLRFQATDYEKSFSQSLKNLQNFITAPLSLEDYYKIIASADDAKRHERTSLTLINSILNNTDFRTWTFYLVERFASTDSISSLVQAMDAHTKEEQDLQGNEHVVQLLNNIMTLIASGDTNVSLNTLIVFFCNLAFAISKVSYEKIYEPIYLLLKNLFDTKDRFDGDDLNIFVAYIASTILVINRQKPQFSQHEMMKKIMELLFDDEIADYYITLPVVELCYKAGFEIPYDCNQIIELIKYGDPCYNHSAVSLLESKYHKVDDKMRVLNWIMNEIANITSGKLATIRFDSSYIKVPQTSETINKNTNNLLGTCSELIQMCRKLLSQKDPNLIKIINFVLTRFSPSSSNVEIDEEMKQFDDRILLYAVFNILSNSIAINYKCSLIKDNSKGTIYYISDFDMKNKSVSCWALPFTQSSVMINMSLNKNLCPINMFPFNSNLYPNIDILIPYFTSILTNTQSSMFMENLTFYVLNSMKEYTSQENFICNLSKEIGSCSIYPSLCTNINNDFLNYLKQHLANNRGGFTCPQSVIPIFQVASPTYNLNDDQYSITSNVLSSDCRSILFISSILPDEKSTFLIIDCNEATHFDIGITSVLTSVEYIIVPHVRNKYLISYEPEQKTAKIFEFESKVFIREITFTDSQVFFYVALYQKQSVKYLITTFVPKGYEDIFKFTYIEPYNLASKIIFRKNRKVTLNEENIQPKNFFRPLKNMSTNNNDECFGKLIIYSSDSLAAPIRQMNINQNGTKYTHPTVFSPEYDQIIVTSPFMKHREICYLDDDAKISPFSHAMFEVSCSESNIPLSENISSKKNVLPPITPNNYLLCPADFINLYATSIADQCRQWTYNHLFSRYLLSSMALEQTLNQFKVNEIMLIKFFNSLLLLIEPLKINTSTSESPIDFTLNVLSSTVSAAKQLIHEASLFIFNFLLERPEYVMIWHDYLIKMLQNGYYHTALKNKQGLIYLPPNSRQSFEGTNEMIYIIIKNNSYSDHKVFASVFGNIANNSGLISSIYYFSGSFLIGTNAQSGVIVIPYNSQANESLYGTVFEMMINYKYFIKYLKSMNCQYDLLQKIRLDLYCCIVDALIAQTPFFSCYGQPVLQYLVDNLPPFVNNFDPTYIQKINLLAHFSDLKNNEYIKIFLEEQQTIWDERYLISLKTYFPEFMTESEVIESKKLKTISPLTIPECTFPNELSNNTATNKIMQTIKRVLIPRETITGFPFHVLMKWWIQITHEFPPFTSKILSNNKKIMIHFDLFVPNKVYLMLKSMNNKKPKIIVSFTENGHGKIIDIDKEITMFGNEGKFYLTLDIGSWNEYEFFFRCNAKFNQEEFITQYKDRFVSDMKNLSILWANKLDTQLLKLIPYSFFKKKSVFLNKIDQYNFKFSQLHVNLNLLILRSRLLLILNWLVSNKYANFVTDTILRKLMPSISAALKMSNLKSLIESHSSNNYSHFSIHRKKAYDIRLGLSDDLNMTLISQMTKIYNEPGMFRTLGDRPWKVEFRNEKGIDAGGLGRELVAECVADLMAPECGLSIPVPNARNEVGDNREFMIPIADTRIGDPKQHYRFAGALIAICMRTGLVQQFLYPPFIWEYLLTGKLEIESIYDIDQNYKLLIDSLNDAQQSDMDPTTFINRFNLKFVIFDSRGSECLLTQRGRTEQVILSNVSNFIALANEFRLNEMRANLDEIRNGLWENLDFKPPAALDWSTLEYAACGEKEITVEMLKEVTVFEEISQEQQALFWRVIESFTSEQRSALLKFATGRVRIPPNFRKGSEFLRLDRGGKDCLPTASTCSHALHYPMYTSFEKAFNMLRVAIEFTGSFENS